MSSRRAWVAAIGFTVLLASLSAGLPADGFFAGDPGVKLIAAQAAWEHPLRPLELDLPRINGAPAPQFLSPFFVHHEGHAHAITSPLFPILSAPFIGFFGVRGAYVLPIFAFGLLLVCMGVLAERLRLAAGTIGILLTAFCSPMVFYGLEYWEHLPALAAVMAGVTLLAVGRTGWKIAAAGLLLSLAALLRPEGVWFCIAGGLAAMTILPSRSRAVLAMAFAAGMLPIVVFNYLHFGNLSGVHVSSNLGALVTDWPRSRIMLLDRWFGPSGNWAVALALMLMLVGFLWGATPGGRIAGYFGLGLLSTGVALGWLPRENLWAAAPTAALALAPVEPGQGPSIARAVGWATLLGIVAVIATAPNDGGAQWGPRYILFAAPVLLLVAAHKIRILWTDHGAERWFARAAVVLVLVAALVTTRAAYRELRASKRYYSRLAYATALASHDVSFIVSNIWWFDQINAGAAVNATFLYAKDAAAAQAALRQTSPATVLLATSEESEFLTTLGAWAEGTCYVNKDRQELAERRVVLQRVECNVATTARPSAR
ncbi:MAG: hypothetical protein HYU53_05245 [Acidobacteria bacterium]|nr:hypothetical protein [Acidobacteriota bacterium]